MIKCVFKEKPVITDSLLDNREKLWHRKLPKSFRQFIKEFGAGIPSVLTVIKDKWIIEQFLCLVPKISESAIGGWDIDAVMTQHDIFLAFSENSIGADLLPFAILNHDALLCLCYESEEPRVAIWQLSGSKEFSPNYTVIADSFDIFINRL